MAFSASLLGAIYRTLDDPDSSQTKNTTTEQNKKLQSDLWRSNNKKQQQPCYIPNSSYLFSPDRHKNMARNNSSKTLPQEKKKKNNSNPIRSRWKGLTNTKGHSNNVTNTKGHSNTCTTTSTTTPFGNFIKSIFSTKSKKNKKMKKQHAESIEVQPLAKKVVVPIMPAPEPVVEHKVVRFCETRDSNVDHHDVSLEAEKVKMQVENILKGLENEKGEEIFEEGSEESSDLFELDNMTEFGSDEMPLCGATHPPIYCT